MYPGCLKVYYEATETVEEYQKNVDEYGGYEGASDIINAINDVIKSKPSKTSKTRESMLKFFDEMEVFFVSIKR